MSKFSLSPRGKSMLDALSTHVQDRLDSRLKKFEGRTDTQAKTEIKKALEKYVLQTLLIKGANSAAGVAIATHIAKAIHPDPPVRAVSNLLVDFDSLPDREVVGSHVLPNSDSLADTSGNGAVNASAYELYLLLEIRFEGKKLGEWLAECDQDALAAFASGAGADDDSDVYSILLEPKNQRVATDARLKQVYWLVSDDPLDDNAYHLLAPLYASSLAHRVYAKVNPNVWFYGDHNKAARKALRERAPFEDGYTSYPNLAVQKLGGTKPQNISQLNSERGGQNYLLASLPPHWQSKTVYPPMGGAMRAFERRQQVRLTLDELKRFLEADPANNMHTRDFRDDLTTVLVDELMLFTLEMHTLPPGWTSDERCRLSLDEQFWLDPGRADQDVEFAMARSQSAWHEDVCARAASWLNRALGRDNDLMFGDAEHRHWQGEFDGVLKSFRRQLDDMQDALREDDEGEAA